MKWISVKDELPNLDFEVTVNDKYGSVSSGWLISEDGDKIFVDAAGVQYNNITHWQPLPVGIISENI